MHAILVITSVVLSYAVAKTSQGKGIVAVCRA